MSGNIIIGIAGGTGSGKTSVAKAIVKDFSEGQTIIIEQDWYYKNLPDYEPDTVKGWNFDHPDAIEFDRLIRDLKSLKDGLAIEVPQYDYARHRRRDAGSQRAPQEPGRSDRSLSSRLFPPALAQWG